MTQRWMMLRRTAAVLAVASPLLLAGCHNFFLCQKASCPASGSGTSTSGADYVYTTNASSNTDAIAAYDIGSGALTAISGSPFALSYVPVALVVAPSDDFLYVATSPGASNPGVHVYAIGSDGALTIPSNDAVDVSDDVASMDISPDGGYLFTLNSSGQLLTEYTVNTSTGALALVQSFILPGVTCTIESGTSTPASQSCTVKAAPSKNFVVVSVGTAGDAIFPYSSSGGITNASYTALIPSGSTVSAPSGDFSLALDDNDYAYIARTEALAVYPIVSGVTTPSQAASVSYASGVVPRSVVLSTDYTHVYTANEGASTISGFSIGGSGGLSSVTGSPFTGPTNVSAIGTDNSGDYMVALGYNSSSGLQLFSIGSAGALTSVATAASGTSTSYPAVLAMTH